MHHYKDDEGLTAQLLVQKEGLSAVRGATPTLKRISHN